MNRSNQGFTLIEVMVSLAIFALLAASISIANIQSLRGARQLEEQIQARWINQNEMTKLRLLDTLPQAGTSTKTVLFNNKEWRVTTILEVEDSELLGPYIRHIQLSTGLNTDDKPIDVLNAIIGKVASP